MKDIYIIILLLFFSTNLIGQNIESKYSPGERYALIIGVSKHKNPANNLTYAEKDASDFNNALLKYGNFKKENIKLLTNKNATRENIRKGIEGWLKSKLKKNDLAIIFFSGHGTQFPDADGDEDDGLDECLIPYDFDNSDISSVISDDIFAYWVRNLKSEKIMIIFDNCYSGGAAKQKGISFPGAKGNIGKDDFSKDLIREVPRKGTSLLAASKASQVSFESSEFKNGPFTHFLINSISSKYDNDFNKIINSSELYYATREETLKYSKNNFNKEQEPIFINMIEEDVDIFYLPNIKTKSKNSEQIETLKYKAKQEKDKKKRIEIYKEMYNTDPYNEEFNHLLASEYEWDNNYLKAIDHYKYILSIKNKKYSYGPSIPARIARLYEKSGQIELAIYNYSEAIKFEPNNPSLYNEISKNYLTLKDTLAATNNLNKSIDVQPLQKKPYLSLFYINIQQGNYSIAKEIIEKSYAINSNDFETQYWFNLINNKNNNLPSFEESSGINVKWADIKKEKSGTNYYLNGKLLNKNEHQLNSIQDAINDYPYYADFYKEYIKYVKDNSLDLNLNKHIKNYLLYSKLSPDKSFIENYIR